jgi:hypothetical protein
MSELFSYVLLTELNNPHALNCGIIFSFSSLTSHVAGEENKRMHLKKLAVDGGRAPLRHPIFDAGRKKRTANS